MTGAMRKLMAEKPEEFDPRAFFKVATAAAKGICQARFEAFGCAGQASKIRVTPMDSMAVRYAKGELTAVVQ
jgi:fructose-bisphosphate aldolase class II